MPCRCAGVDGRSESLPLESRETKRKDSVLTVCEMWLVGTAVRLSRKALTVWLAMMMRCALVLVAYTFFHHAAFSLSAVG